MRHVQSWIASNPSNPSQEAGRIGFCESVGCVLAIEKLYCTSWVRILKRQKCIGIRHNA